MPLSWPCCSRWQPWERSPTRITTLTPHARWLDESQPDKEGVQFEAIKAQLAEMPSIEYVWYDYSCLPQFPRNVREDEEFASMLPNINILYLGMKVLILQDISYNGRFWTQVHRGWGLARCTMHARSVPSLL